MVDFPAMLVYWRVWLGMQHSISTGREREMANIQRLAAEKAQHQGFPKLPPNRRGFVESLDELLFQNHTVYKFC